MTEKTQVTFLIRVILAVGLIGIAACLLLTALSAEVALGDPGYPGVTPTWGPRPTPTVDWSFATPGYEGATYACYLSMVRR